MAKGVGKDQDGLACGEEGGRDGAGWVIGLVEPEVKDGGSVSTNTGTSTA